MMRHDIDPRDVVKLRKQGLSLGKIAARLHASDWTIAERLKKAGQPFTPAAVTPAQLAEFQHYADPAWEARNHIAKQVACRKCGRLLHGITPTHLALDQMTMADYDHQYPDAPSMNCAILLGHSSLKGRVNLEEFMAAGAARYLTPAEMADHLRDHLYEKHHGIANYIACRVCGFKSKDSLYMHLKKRHRYTLAQYRDRFPGVDYFTVRLQAERSDRNRGKLRQQAAQGKILAALKTMPESGARIVLYLIQHREALNAEVFAATGKTLSTDRMRILRGIAGVPGPKGRPSKKL
jgi:hypothetical protein